MPEEAMSQQRPFLRDGLVLVCGLTLLAVLHLLGWAVPGNWWLFIAFLIGGPLVLHWALRPKDGVWQSDNLLAIGLAAAYVGGVIYLTGWGPVLAIGFVQLATGLGALGRTWRPLAILSTVTIGAGQAATALGLFHTYLSPGTAQAMGTLGMMCVLFAIRSMGRNDAARQAAEQALAASEERFRTVLQDSQDVIVITDAEGTAFFVSSAVEHVMGWTVEEYRHQQNDLLHPDDHAAGHAMVEALESGSRSHTTELRLQHGDGTWRWHEVSARNLIDHPAVGGYVFSHRDITARKHQQEQLVYEAEHDSLTGLANRSALHDILASWGASSGLGAVLYLDLDGFKQVNDELGHTAGDELLIHTAQVLRDCVLGADTVARLGGDEFVVVLAAIHDPADAIAVAQRIIERLDRPRLPTGQAITARASVGIAVCQRPLSDARDVLRRADEAMYDAKRDGTHGWRLHGESVAALQPSA